MRLRKGVLGLNERLCDYLQAKAAAFAFPGRGASLPPVLLIALPKSGSTYMQRALGRTLRVQVQHFSAAGISGSSFRLADLCRFAEGNVISREHLQPRAISPKLLGEYGINKAVLHVRDPRDAIVSWTRHMDRSLATRGLRFVELSCEMAVPAVYRDWDFARRLEWQVENKLPDFVRWIERWLALVAGNSDVEFLITDYAELADDARGLVIRILDFYGIEHKPEWISMPSVAYGKNNIFSDLETRDSADWMAEMSRDVLAAAHAQMPAALARRFGWPHPEQASNDR
ncbi:sulfotransferase domain-containing protein [Dongia sp.]|uniref:sulfotransferase domain-containing protein n=1 Tax=Dongia sp. TaxID=1977262 RepID=UPI003750C928